MTADLPRCAVCRVTVSAGVSVIFRPDGRVQHVECPPVVCPVCGSEIRPNTPLRRDGDAVLHGNCWVRRARATERVSDGGGGIVALIRARLASGALPSAPPVRVWGSMSPNRPACAGCGERIVDEAEYELEFDGAVSVRMHRVCYGIWDEARRQAKPIGGGSAASPWTLFFEVSVAERVAGDALMFSEMLAAAAETIAACAGGRNASARTRERSRTLAHRARALRALVSTQRGQRRAARIAAPAR